MATISEIRQKFPQYSDLSDEQLAQGMHRKFYSDMPFEQFAQKVGYSAQPAQEPAPRKTGDSDYAGAFFRPIIQGVGSIPGLAADAGIGLRNIGERIAEKTGLAQPIINLNRKLAGDSQVLQSILPQGLGQAEAFMPQFNRSLEQAFPAPASRVNKGAEFVSTVLAGSRVPAPQATQQAPAGFVRSTAPSVAEQTLGQAQKQGYVVPPATARPTLGNRIMEGAAGKITTAQAAAVKNQGVTNALARRALDLPDDAPLTIATLKGIREKAGTAYGEVGKAGDIVTDGQYLDELANIGKGAEKIIKDFPDADVAASEKIKKLVDSLLQDKFNSKSALEYLKEMRAQASANLSFQNSGDPARKALGMAQREAAGTLEDLITRHLAKSGKPELASAFENARRTIAKTYTVQSALNESTGNIAAQALGSQLKKGKPLSDELETAAKFARAFPKAAREINESFPGISPWDFGWGGIGSVVAGNPLPAAYPFVRMGLRAYMLSPQGQKAALTPGLGQGIPPEFIMGAVPAASGQ